MVKYRTVLLKTQVFKDTKKHLSNNLQRKAYKYQLEKQVSKHQQGIRIYRH